MASPTPPPLRPHRTRSFDPTTRSRRTLIITLSAFIPILVIWSASVGTITITPATTWQALTDFDPLNTQHLLVVHQRIPRALLAVVVGCCLGVAGAIMQALTRNPLAEPGLLGVNAGAALLIACGISFLGISQPSGYLWLGLLGAALAGTGVYLLGGLRSGTNPIRLVLAGAALSVVLTALTQLVLLNGDETVYDQYRYWMVGSLAGRGYDTLVVTTVLAVLGLATAATLARSLDSAMLGEDLGRALGLNQTRVWVFASLTVIVLAGSATAAAGPIAFLGLATPHLARLLVGVNHRWVLPASGLIAGILMVLADTLGRIIPPRGEISVGIMIALIGGPFFIWLVRRRNVVQL